jgi:AraC-like DNA-binding protein
MFSTAPAAVTAPQLPPELFYAKFASRVTLSVMGKMQPATAEQFRRDPVGRYLAGRSFLLWVYDETLAGSMYFGRPDERDFPTLLAMADMPFHERLAQKWDAVVDCSGMDVLQPEAFEHLSRYVPFIAPILARLHRAALVRPPGILGATLAGVYYQAVQGYSSAAMFSDRVEGFRWLERTDGDKACAELDRLAGELSTVPALLRELREALTTTPRGLAVETVARRLSLSPRSLQRRLNDLGTSFRAEVDRARVRVAESLLVESDLKLQAIGAAAGFMTPSHFSAAFRRITGESPSEFRGRRQNCRAHLRNIPIGPSASDSSGRSR